MALCEFAHKLTARIHDMSEEDIQALREAGCTDPEIHDATQVIGYFNYINRMAEGLGVSIEI